jgi:phosphohistidine phosphatase
MYLYLIQHGEAKTKEEDPERGLTDEGAANAEKAGNFLKKMLTESKTRIISIWHSGKTRAEQTARIIAKTLRCDTPLEQCGGLNPDDDISIIRQKLKSLHLGAFIIVGHLPHLSKLASDLLANDQRQLIIRFRNAGIVCLTFTGDNEFRNWTLEWMVTPEIMG